MKKINCNIIKDILPLYVDDVVSEDTKELVEEHLNKCEFCNTEYKRMSGKMQMPVECDVQPIKTLNKKIKKEKIISALAASLISVLILGLLGFWTLFIGKPVEKDRVEITTEIQKPHDAYADPEFVVHSNIKDGTTMISKEKKIYKIDENGDEILAGYEVEIREPLLKFIHFNPSGYSFGYSYQEMGAPAEEFDFVIKVKFKDETVTYSMREEGLFKYYEKR